MSELESDGGCHAGSNKLVEAAKAAGKSDLLDKYKGNRIIKKLGLLLGLSLNLYAHNIDY